MDKSSRGAELLAQGEAARRDGRNDDARAIFSQAIDAYRHEGDILGEARALTRQARSAQIAGDLDWALHDQQQAIALLRRAGDGHRLAHALRQVGDMFVAQGELPHAALSLRESLDLYTKDFEAPPLDVADAYRSAGLLADALDDRDEGRGFWSEAQTRYASTDPDHPRAAEAAERLAALNG